MKRKFKILTMLTALLMLLCCAGCGSSGSAGPVTVTLWHVYGGQADSPLNDLIDEFNSTVGAEQNIRVQVTSVTNTNTIHENVLAAAYGDPGSPELPDMFVSYPKTVLAMPDMSVLVDYRDYFSDDELSEFIPAFLDEGMIDGRLLVLPAAKSTEIMFINKTAFDRFSAATGAEPGELSTWDGLFRLSQEYYKWTDSLTPDIPGDGKIFFVHDYHFNYFQVGVESLGEDFFSDGTLAFSPAFDRVWEPYARAALSGSVWLQGGYATDPLRTGDSIVSVASSASILYYSKIVTYPDNTSEEVEIAALPCPCFEDGEKLVMQRGAGICTVKSTPEKEQACISFLKWLTEPEHNVDFVTSLGYMPVKTACFGDYLDKAIASLEDPMYRSLYGAFITTQKEYSFYTPPKLPDYLELETRFEEQVRMTLSAARSVCMEQEADPEDFIQPVLEDFKKTYLK